MGRRRTTGDLIQELKQEADLFAKKSQGESWSIGLVVGFEKHTGFVFHGEDKEPLKKLNELDLLGGLHFMTNYGVKNKSEFIPGRWKNMQKNVGFKAISMNW